jgi:hypothetical protein
MPPLQGPAAGWADLGYWWLVCYRE